MALRRRLPIAALALLAVVAGALVAPVAQAAESDRGRTTALLSRAHHGGFPNGPSRNGEISHDQRIGRYAAFESDASDIVAGDTNGLTDVFVVARAQPWGSNGTPWEAGATRLASRGLGGAPANGRSWGAVLDGDSHHAARCVAFISEASNLVRGDTNGVADAFVLRLDNHRITRVSVASNGRQANGPTESVSIDGACERVAFVARATNLSLTRTRNLAWLTARTRRPRGGTRQVYVRVIKASGFDAAFEGLTFLASATASGAPGNGDSTEAVFGRAGKAVAFTSTATNLARGDRSRSSDIYLRSWVRKHRRWRELNNRGANQFVMTTRLVSSTRGGRGGNGASRHPSVTDTGEFVAFETDASNLAPGDPNGFSDVLRADLRNRRTVRQQVASFSAHSGWANGPSRHPVISDAREGVFFESEASNLKPSGAVADDPNGVTDIFFWNEPTGNVSLESRDSDNGYLRRPSGNPATSSRGNYVPFESVDPLVDLPLLEQLLGDLPEDLGLLESLLQIGEQQGRELPVPSGRDAQQVYLRYLGPQ